MPDDTDPDLTREVPTICLTFDTAVGRISTTNASWPILPRTTRKRLLQQYSKQAQDAGSVIHTIGGELGGTVMFENLVQSVDPSYSVAAHEPVCVMANSSDEWISFRAFQTNFAIAQAVVVQVWHDSDAHPVEAKPASRKRKADQAPNSDEHPVRGLRPRKEKVTTAIAGSDAHPAASDLRAHTPLWDNVVAKLDQASSSSEGQQFMRFVAEKCFHGDLCHKNAYGEDLEKPMTLSSKMEILLEVAAERRKTFLKNRRWSGAAQPAPDMMHTIPEEDMRSMWNEWRKDVDSWMNRKNRKTYHDLAYHDKWHQAERMRKSFFNVYVHYLAGHRFLLHKLIQLPIIAQCNGTSSDSAEQPASIVAWIEEFGAHKESPEYNAAVAASQKKADTHKRLSKQICEAQWMVSRGKALSDRAKNGEWEQLDEDQQVLVEQYDGGKLERELKNLLHEAEVRPQRYKGFGVTKQPTVSTSSAVQPAASSSSAGQPAASSSSAMKSEH